MKKSTKGKNSKAKAKSIVMVGLALAVFVLVPALRTPDNTVFANANNQKIAELNKKIEDNQKKIQELKEQGDTLANKMQQIELETSTLQAKIDANEAENNRLNEQIAIAEARIKENKALLADSIKKIYVEGDISSLEILASSSSLSDYVDKQEYRDRVKNKITKLTGEVQELKIEAEQKQIEVGNLLRDQINMRVDLKIKADDLNKLIVETNGREDAYQNQISMDNAEVARLRSEQRSVNSSKLKPLYGLSFVSSSGVLNGGYPAKWDIPPIDSRVDDWGMYSRECVSYAAFKVWQSGRHMPYWGGRGNANRWKDNAANDGIPFDTTNPRKGDVAISMYGYYGHAMYVERVNNDGTILVSQYNYGISGEYSEMTLSVAASGLYFIHF
ncbi:MAG: peptidoglycan DL-endopeptidase CwlO [Patescibacteria group bacterium]|nr:peptidoglycan DL-endopeptidase CwlO [Patescibacteria group bacterium]